MRELAETSDHIRIIGDRLAVYPIETPYDEFGIVDKRALLSSVMGSVAAGYIWTGSYTGPHHIMWPRNAYQAISPKSLRPTATHFRGNPSLKVILPRQLHDYLHVVTEPPLMPDSDVMRQYTHEQHNVHRLYDTIRYHGALHLEHLSHERKEQIRWSTMLAKLDTLDDGILGLMPDKEELANAGIARARQVLRSIARVQGLSNDLSCQDAFFNPPRLDERRAEAA